MLVYTLTVNVEESVASEWLLWIKEDFLVSMLGTGFFDKHHLFKVLHDTEGHTYTFQFFCKDVLLYQQFELEFKKQILQDLMDSFPGKVVYFNTMLEQLDI
jgi:hypothetical protein